MSLPRSGLHPHRPSLLHGCRIGAPIPDPSSGGRQCVGAMGRVGNRLALPRLRANALVGKGAGTAPEAICASGKCWRSRSQSRERNHRASDAACSRLEALSVHSAARLSAVEQYILAYQQYYWPVRSLGGLKLAPFHILASEGAVHTDKPHTWHMATIGRLCAADTEILLATPFQVVDLDDEQSSANAVAWWTDMTSRGGEGMVVKPLNFIAEGRRGVTQPAIKCRGPEYLRIIYGS